MVQIWQEDPGKKKPGAVYIQWTICYGDVWSEYYFCDKCVTADWSDAKEQNYIYKTDVNFCASR